MVKKHTNKQRRRRKNKKFTRGGTSPRSSIKSMIEKVKDMNIKTKSNLDDIRAMRILQEKRKLNFENLKTKINTRDILQKEKSNVVDLLKNELSMCKNELDLCKTDLEKYKKPTRMSSHDYIDIEPFIQPHYDLGTTRQESQPYYDLGTADEDSDLKVSQKRKTLPIIVKETLEKYNIKNKDDLDTFCGGPRTRKKFYDAVKKICIEENCSGKLSDSNIIFYYEHLLPGYKRYKPKNK